MLESVTTPISNIFTEVLNHGNGELNRRIADFLPSATDRVTLGRINRTAANNSMSAPTAKDIYLMKVTQALIAASQRRLALYANGYIPLKLDENSHDAPTVLIKTTHLYRMPYKAV